MKKLIERDKYRRRTVANHETQRVVLRSIIRNRNLVNNMRWSASLMLSDLFVDSSQCRVVNRCLLTGRKSKVRKFYNFSRLSFLRLARNGLISGLKKVSW